VQWRLELRKQLLFCPGKRSVSAAYPRGASELAEERLQRRAFVGTEAVKMQGDAAGLPELSLVIDKRSLTTQLWPVW